MPKKQKQKIPQEVKTLIDEFAKSLSTFDSKVPLPSAIGYLLETLGYPGSPEINPVVVATDFFHAHLVLSNHALILKNTAH